MDHIFKKTIKDGVEMLSFSPALSTKIRVSYIIEDGKFLHKKVWPQGGIQKTIVISEIQNIDKGKWNLRSLVGIRHLIVKTSTTTMLLENISNPDEIRSFILSLKAGKETSKQKESEEELAKEYLYVSAIPEIIYNLLKTIHKGKEHNLIKWKISKGDFINTKQIIAELNVPPIKRKYDDIKFDNIAIIRAPISGKVIEITSNESTPIFETRFPNETLQKYRFLNHMLVIQPLKKERYSLNPFTLPLADYCFLKFAERNTNYFKPLESLYKIVDKSEPLESNIDWKIRLSDNEDLENFAISIPYPSYFLTKNLFGDFRTHYSNKKNSFVEEGEKIVELKRFNETIAHITSPVNGKLIFIGLDYEKEDTLQLINGFRGEYLNGTIWNDDYWPIKEYYNDDFNRVKTLLFIIQPIKGADLKNYVYRSYNQFISAVLKRLEKLYKDEFGIERDLNKKIIENEIKKIELSKGKIVK